MKQSTLTAAPKRRRNQLERSKMRAGTMFILPSLILCLMFMVWPLIEVVRYSITDWNGISKSYNYVGLSNYTHITEIEGFREMMIATITYAVGVTLLVNIVAFIAALALDKKGRGRINRGLLRSLWFLPALLSGDNTAEDLVNTMVEMMPKSFKNQ